MVMKDKSAWDVKGGKKATRPSKSIGAFSPFKGGGSVR